ncbi:MAG: dienelactone hydrolase family protein [Candidatus Micrarchaeaceae archaeon]
MEITSKDVVYKSGNEEIHSYISYPNDSNKYPGVILIHEIFGLDDHIKDVTRRLAKEGYVVLAPDLFSSESLSKILTPLAISKTMKFMMSIPIEKQRDENYRNQEMAKLSQEEQTAIYGVYKTFFIDRPVDKFVDYLSDGLEYILHQNNVNGKIGSVGFCFGGSMSINLACKGKVDASVIFYGENPEPINKVKGVKNAVLGIYGGEDVRITSKVPELVKELSEHKKNISVNIYSGAHHAFFNDTRPQMHNEKASISAWKLLLNFYKEYL